MLLKSTEISPVSTSPPSTLESSTRNELNVEDSAMPATTTSKKVEESSTPSSTLENDISDENNMANIEGHHNGENSITEIVIMASLDTQMNELKGT